MAKKVTITSLRKRYLGMGDDTKELLGLSGQPAWRFLRGLWRDYNIGGYRDTTFSNYDEGEGIEIEQISIEPKKILEYFKLISLNEDLHRYLFGDVENVISKILETKPNDLIGILDFAKRKKPLAKEKYEDYLNRTILGRFFHVDGFREELSRLKSNTDQERMNYFYSKGGKYFLPFDQFRELASIVLDKDPKKVREKDLNLFF